KESNDGGKYAELILQKPLDREKEDTHHLILIASDRGCPVKTGTSIPILEDILPGAVIALIKMVLDREKTPVYNLTITATDQGTPPLSTDKTNSVPISDINDNPPAFEKPSYVAYIPENNPSGTSIFQVKAFDPDLDRNAQITYSMLNSNVKNLPLSFYVSINSETGTLYAQRSFDYEQLRDFQLQVQAQDGGSPISQ
ncbi:hypothetical protein NXF25_008578, partial [Crotalus adamanteus]